LFAVVGCCRSFSQNFSFPSFEPNELAAQIYQRSSKLAVTALPLFFVFCLEAISTQKLECAG